MRRRDFMRGGLASTAFAAAGTAHPLRRAGAADDPEPVDLELVLAVDVSSSISPEEMDLQFQGYAAAFRAADVARRIGAGPIGATACTLFVWSDPDHQQVLVPWTRLEGAADAAAFAAAIDAAPRATGLYTSISGAIDFAAGLFGRAGFEGTRRIVDISGDGADNAARPGRTLARARDDALDSGIVLNGLAILDPDPALASGAGPGPRRAARRVLPRCRHRRARQLPRGGGGVRGLRARGAPQARPRDRACAAARGPEGRTGRRVTPGAARPVRVRSAAAGSGRAPWAT